VPAAPPEPLVALYPKQVEFLNSAAPFKAFAAGIAAGKSHVLCYSALRRVRRRLYMVTAPTYPVLRDATLRSFFELTDRLRIPFEYHRSEHRVLLPRSGAEVLFRSTDNPDLLRGPNLAGVAMDEASLSPRAAYDVLVGRLRQGGEAGWLEAAFTPRGRTHWTYEVFGPDPTTGLDKPDTHLVRASTADNPFLDPEFLRRVAGQYGNTQFARQELGGEFVQMEGAEFPAGWFDNLFFHSWPDPGHLPWRVIYCDPSSGANETTDLQAVVQLALGPPDNTLYAECWVGRDSPPTRLVTRVLDAVRAWGPVDGAAFEVNSTLGFLKAEVERVDALHPNVVPWVYVTNRAPKIDRVRKLVPYLETGRLKVRDTEGGRTLVNQLRDFPGCANDDAADAHAGAVWLLQKLVHGG
jgi:phage terminase large subunit-like protein